MEDKHLKKEISLFMATMLVCGNMIGSGVFMLPSTLAQVSGPGATIIAWIITTIGSILIAISFANLGTKYPSTGGAYQYTKEAFGDFAGFLSAWLYWNGSWIGNAAIIVATNEEPTDPLEPTKYPSEYDLATSFCAIRYNTA